MKTLTPNQITELKSKRQSGILIKELMAEYKLSKKSIYNYLELAKEGDGNFATPNLSQDSYSRADNG